MIRKIIGVSLVVASFIIISPVLAQTTTGATGVVSSSVGDKIACVKGAVATREVAITTAYTAYTGSVSAAYATRANELAGAYSNTTVKAVHAGVKVAWADFNKTTKAANKTWNTSRNTIWTTFKTATKACKSPAGVSDSANSSSEIKGQ